MLNDVINTCEELKKYVFIIDRGTKGNIIIKFNNNNFYHLIGLQHTNIDLFIPKSIKNQANKYKHIKKNLSKFNSIIENQTKKNNSLLNRISSFPKILDVLKGAESQLYNLKINTPNSLYNGDYGLVKLYENELCCLLGLKEEYIENKNVFCAPQSWMASKRRNKIIENRRPIYYKDINNISIDLYAE